MLQLDGKLNKPMQFKCIIYGGSGGKALSRWAIFAISWKK